MFVGLISQDNSIGSERRSVGILQDLILYPFSKRVEYIKTNCSKLTDITKFADYWQDLKFYLQLFGYTESVQFVEDNNLSKLRSHEEEKLISLLLIGTTSSKFGSIIHFHNNDVSKAVGVLLDLKLKSSDALKNIVFELSGTMGRIRLLSASHEDKRAYVRQFEHIHKQILHYNLVNELSYDKILEFAYDNLANDPSFKVQVVEFENRFKTGDVEDALPGHRRFVDVASLVGIVKDNRHSLSINGMSDLSLHGEDEYGAPGEAEFF